MKSPEDVHAEVFRIFKSRHRDWLGAGSEAEPAQSQRWPLEIRLGTPARKPALEDLEAIQHWCLAWQAWRGTGTLQWAERGWSQWGEHKLPDKLLLGNASEVARFLNQSASWEMGRSRFHELSHRWPRLVRELPRHYQTLAECDDADFSRLISMLTWLENNPASLLYPRQLPIAGLDSKWIEARRGLVAALLAAMREDPVGDTEFHRVCGLRTQPDLVRMRILDAPMRTALRGLGDISIPVEHLAQLALPVSNLLIVENLQTGLALEDLPGTVAFMARGYNVDFLCNIPWQEARAFYWGDLDTHGFAILDKARRYLPDLESAFMDEATLIANKDLWGEEKEPVRSCALTHLSAVELEVFTLLKQNLLENHVRLEQERIPWETVRHTLRQLMI